MKYYTTEEVAELLKLHTRTVREYLKSGQLRGYKLGDTWRISEEDIQEFLEARANRPRKRKSIEQPEQAEQTE